MQIHAAFRDVVLFVGFDLAEHGMALNDGRRRCLVIRALATVGAMRGETVVADDVGSVIWIDMSGWKRKPHSGHVSPDVGSIRASPGAGGVRTGRKVPAPRKSSSAMPLGRMRGIGRGGSSPHQLGALYTGPVYVGTLAYCVAEGDAGVMSLRASFDFYSLGSEVPPSTFCRGDDSDGSVSAPVDVVA
jgi:hypothetical protein